MVLLGSFLLGELCRASVRTVTTVYRAVSGRPDALPGVVGAIRTLGQLIHDEADPLLCPKCGSKMKIISFVERHQTEVIEKILRHCGL